MATPQDKIGDLFDAPAPPTMPKRPRTSPKPADDISDLFDDGPRAAAPRLPSSTTPAPSVDARLDSFVSDIMGEASRRAGYTYKLGSGGRTPAEQAEKVAGGLSKTYNSKHLSGRGRDVLAFDSEGNYITDGQHEAYKGLGDVFREKVKASPVRVKWGGDFAGFYDPGHFEIDEDGYVQAASTIDDLFDPADDDLGPPEVIQQATDRVTGKTLALDDARRETRPDASEALPVESAPPALPERESFDPRTMEGRAARDERRATERKANAFLEMDVPLPSGVRDWSEATGDAAVRAGVEKFARTRGIPSEFVTEWMKKNASTGYSMRDREGRETTPADMLNADSYDGEKRTLRVKLSAAHLSKLEDDYKASKGALSRAADFVTDDETSPGEKMLAVATPPARAIGTAAAFVARPFQAGSAGFWAGVRGEGLGAFGTAYETEMTGVTPPEGENVIGEALRGSKTLAGINPRLPALLGGIADTVADPANLLPLGAAAKGAKMLGATGKLEKVGDAARGVGLMERGIVDVRPLGLMDEAGSLRAALDSSQASGRETAALEQRLNSVLETARKIRAGEALTPEEIALHAEVRAKYAPTLEEHFDVEMRTEDGRRLVYSTETGELRDAATGALLDPETGKPLEVEGAVEPKAIAEDSVENSAIRNPQSADAAPAPVPEKPETLRAQLQALVAGRRAVVEVTPDALTNVDDKFVLPRGMRSFKTFDNGRIVYDPRRVTREEVVEAMDNGRLGELMGHVTPKAESDGTVVAARDARTGTELQASYANTETAGAQGDAFASQYPGARVEVGGASLERRLLAEREAARPGPEPLPPRDDVGLFARDKGHDSNAPQRSEGTGAQASAPHDEALAHARDRAAFYDNEAANARGRAARENAAAIAEDYRAEIARLEGGDTSAPAAVEGYDLAAPPPARPSVARRVIVSVGDVADAMKSSVYGGDASIALRQALFPLIMEPRATAKGLAQGVPSAFSEKQHARFVQRLGELPVAKEGLEMGLALDTLTGTRIEYFPSKAASKLPWVGPAERLASAQLDAVRVNLYEKLAGELRAQGLTPRSAPEEFRAVARIVNVTSGRGELGVITKPLAPVLNKALGSPKLLKSRFQVLNPLEYARLPPAARRIALRKAGRVAAGFAGIFGLAYMTADEVGLDPRKSNFGLARYGDTTYDLTGGMAHKIKFIFNLAASVGATAKKYRKGEEIAYAETPAGVVTHFLRSQLSPAASLGADAVTGETYDKRAFTWTEGTIRRVTPLFTQDIYDGFVEGGGLSGAAKALPAFLGVGLRTRDPEKMKKEFAEAREASRIAKTKEAVAVSVAGASPAVRDELTRLKLLIPQLPKNISTTGLTGDSVKLRSKDGEQLAGLSDEEFEKLKQAYAAEVLGLLDETIANPDFDSFESDGDKRKYLDFVLKEHRKRFLTGARRQARGRQSIELDKIEELQRKLEGRSRQPKPGERVKF